jgi:SAM-dependent methyltransferase
MRAAVFAVSAALLALEILLLRLFAIEHYHHFAYAVIAIAMLGGGTSGTLLVLLRERVRGRERRLFILACSAFACLALGAPWLAERVRFEPTALVWSPRAWLGLAAVQVVLALPFAAGTAAVVLAIQAEPRRAPHLYAANLAGSGVGALAALLLTLVPPPLAPRVTPYKALPQVEAFPGARRLGERWSPLGWLTAVEAPAFHYAPGLSLNFRGALPPQVAFFTDGDLAGAATRWRGDGAAAAFTDWIPSAVAYQLPAQRVLVLGAGPGLEVLSALAHGASRVVAVELDPAVAALERRLVDPASDVYADPRVQLVIADARSFASRSRERFDLVVLGPTEGFGAAAAGVRATSEDYLTTVEALGSYLRLLRPGGALVLERWVRTPPRDNVRAILSAGEALRGRGRTPGPHGGPGPRFAFFRNWAAGTLLVRPEGFAPEERRRLLAFARSRLLDVDWLAGPVPDTVPAPNALVRPVFREVAAAVAEGADASDAFARSYLFDVRPATDDRPYFSHFLRLGLLRRLLALGAPSWLPFAEWGYVAVLATLAEGALVAAVLMLFPAVVLARRAPGLPLGRIAAYFSALGVGYLLVEMAFVQKLQLLLGHPVYAVSATLAGFLVCSGLGSWWSARSRAGPRPALAVAALVTLELAVAALVIRWAQPLPFAPRAALALLLVAPPAFAMGMPFPAGLRALAGTDGDAAGTAPGSGALAWAFAANGFASVVAGSLAALLAIEFGFRWVLAGAVLCYLAAAGAIYRPRQILQRSTTSSPRTT